MSDPATRTIRVAVAGLGFGAAVHVPGFRRIPGVEVCALAGTDRARAADWAAKLAIPAAVDGYQALLDAAPDAVSLALPPAINSVAVEFFLQRRIPVLSEKPLAQDGEDARRLLALAGDLPCAVDFEFAELPAFRVVKQAIEAGAVGEVRAVHIFWAVEALAVRLKRNSWKTDASGGVLPLLFCHTAYLIEWLFPRVRRLLARLQAGGEAWSLASRSPADTVHLTAELESGAIITAFVSNAAPGLSAHRWAIIGSDASLTIANESRAYMAGFRVQKHTHDGATELHADGQEGPEDSRIAPFASLARRFIEALRTRGSMRPGFCDGWRAAAIADAVRQSSLRTTPVAVPESAA